MRILVTGVTGFAGGHLTEALLAGKDVELHGLSRRARWPEEWRHLEGRVQLWSCDLCNGSNLRQRLAQIRPDQVYHLAGYAQPGKSFQDADAAWESNLTATRRLYEAIAEAAGSPDPPRAPRMLYVGSGLVYGDPETPDQAHDERSPFRPASPYASSKAAADLVSYEFTRTCGLDIVRARPFNHIGPRQSPEFAVAHFAQQLAAIEQGVRRGSADPAVLETGNLQPQRDLTDVRDIVQAYILLMERGRTGEAYNVASGEAHAMQSVLDRLLALVQVPVEIRQRDTLVRSTETAVIRGDTSKLRKETGWTPRYPLNQSLRDTLDYWRQNSEDRGSRIENPKRSQIEG
jgi:GDP-4-dehydro-6-deoxy-D-mannose reductase